MNDEGQPGQVINPGDQPSENPTTEPGASKAPEHLPDVDEPQQEEQLAYASTAREAEYVDPLDQDTEVVNWSASEFIEHQKSVGWFLILAGVTLLLCIGVFFLTRDWFGPFIIIVLAIIFGIGAARQPRVLDYSVDASGVGIGNKHYTFEDFRAFGIVNEGPVESIVLLPSKRWMPAINLYFAPEDGDKIADALGAFMPFEERASGLTDRFLHKIRF